MPETRSKARTGEKDDVAGETLNASIATGSKRKQLSKDKSDERKAEAEHNGESLSSEQPPAKAHKTEESDGLDQDKLDRLLESHGRFPLADYGLEEPEKPTAATLLAHLFNAMLTSARISHTLAAKSVACLIEAGYSDIETLKNSSWQERTEVLTKGGYTRYREKTATGLGELAEFLSTKYEGDLNKLREAGNDDPHKIRDLIKEVKGLGDVGVNIFQDTVQALWPCMAPYVDPRSFSTAEELGIGQDIEKLWEGVGQDAKKMAMLCNALTTVRLEKRQDDFKDENDREGSEEKD